MSWFNCKTCLIVPLALMSGACGFTPVYAPGGTGQILFNEVKVQAPEDIPSNSDVAPYFIVRALEERVGRGSGGTYQLDLQLAQSSEGQAITADNEITRYSVEGTANYALTRVSDGEVLTSGSVTNFTGYSATGTTVDTLASERDAEERLMVILADQIMTRLYTSPELSAIGAE